MRPLGFLIRTLNINESEHPYVLASVAAHKPTDDAEKEGPLESKRTSKRIERSAEKRNEPFSLRGGIPGNISYLGLIIQGKTV